MPWRWPAWMSLEVDDKERPEFGLTDLSVFFLKWSRMLARPLSRPSCERSELKDPSPSLSSSIPSINSSSFSQLCQSLLPSWRRELLLQLSSALSGFETNPLLQPDCIEAIIGSNFFTLLNLCVTWSSSLTVSSFSSSSLLDSACSKGKVDLASQSIILLLQTWGNCWGSKSWLLCRTPGFFIFLIPSEMPESRT